MMVLDDDDDGDDDDDAAGDYDTVDDDDEGDDGTMCFVCAAHFKNAVHANLGYTPHEHG